MGRTVPSFRNVIAEEKQEWKPFRNALSKSERKAFDEMWDIPKLYVIACSNACSLVPFHPIALSILLHHYKDLMECSKRVERLMNNNSKASSTTTMTADNINDFQNEMEQEEEEGFEVQQQQHDELTLFDFL